MVFEHKYMNIRPSDYRRRLKYQTNSPVVEHVSQMIFGKVAMMEGAVVHYNSVAIRQHWITVFIDSLQTFCKELDHFKAV